MTHKILIIEDEDGIAFMIQDRLLSEGYEVEHCSDGLLGEKTAKTGNYDLILLDVMLPGKDGFQICQSLREHNIVTPILMLTARATNIDTIMGLKLGADDYLTKPFDMQILLARIQALLRRFTNNSSEATATNENAIAFGEFELDFNKQELSKQGNVINLNAQEYRLLAFFVNHPDRILSRDELLNEVWGIESDISTRTVDVHVAWLRKKIDDLPVAKHLITLRSRGYKFVL
jgi:DNA-binding response OmpR family regulator